MKKIIIIVAVFCSFVFSQAQAAEECPVHKLTISEIDNVIPASGQTELGSILLNQLVSYVSSPGVAIAAITGAAAYYADVLLFDHQLLPEATRADWTTFANNFDPILSAQDDLMVHFNGVNVLPGTYPYEIILDPDAYNGEAFDWVPNFEDVYQPTFFRTQLVLNKSFSFYKEGTLDLIEWDGGTFGSGHDDMGSILFSSPEDGQPYETTYTITKACSSVEEIFSVPVPWGCRNNAVYRVSYKVEPYQGKLEDIPERLICGKNVCADARSSTNWDDRSFYSITFPEDLRECPPAYTPWTGAKIYNNGSWLGVTEVSGKLYRACELVPSALMAPSSCGSDFLPLANVSDLNDGDIIVMKGLTATADSNDDYLSSSEGQYLARCRGCVPGAPPGLLENAVVHVIDPNRTAAQWTVKKLANNKFALRSETGKYLARCNGCIPGAAGDSAFIHVSDPTNQPAAQFTIEPAAEANNFTLRSDNAKYLSPCFDCVPGRNSLGYRFNGSLHLTDPSNIFTGWEISVIQKDRIDPVIYSDNRTFDSDITVKPSEIWEVDAGEVVTINYGAALIIADGASIENNGTIINNGSIKLGSLGKLINQGTIVNKEIIRLSGGVIDNLSSGVIDNSQGNHIQNYAGVINNPGAIYDPYGEYYGVNPTINLPSTSYFLGTNESGLWTCIYLSGSSSNWDSVSNTCSVGNTWIPEGESLSIAAGARLQLKGLLANNGEIFNGGTINNRDGILKQCSLNGLTGNAPTPNPAQACVPTTDQLECEVYDGINSSASFDITSQTCIIIGADILSDEVVTIRTGVTWKVSGVRNYGSINIEEGGILRIGDAGAVASLYNMDTVEGSSTGQQGTINNKGLVSVGFDGNQGIPSDIQNNGVINNFGTIDNRGNIVGSGQIGNPACAIYNLIHDQAGNPWGSPYDPEGEFHDISPDFCPPPDGDNDGVADELDVFPYNSNEDTDTDGDGVGDVGDAFPLNSSESSDLGDGDCGVIVTQTEDSGNNCGDNSDKFPLNPLETIDTDEDCGEITIQTVDSGNGCGDNSDKFPLNPYETNDSDSDCGVIDPQAQTIDSGNSCGDNSDAFPLDSGETRDSDNDGVGDNTDAFPNDADNTRLIAADNSNGWSLATGIFSTSAMQDPIPEGLPSGVDLPFGIAVIELNSGTIGSESVINISYPTALDPAMVWWKYGPTTSNSTPHWYVFDGAVISGNTVTLTIKDGGTGDDDLIENGSITDPGGPGLPVATVITETPVNEQPASGSSGGAVNLWFLLLLSGLYLRRFYN